LSYSASACIICTLTQHSDVEHGTHLRATSVKQSADNESKFVKTADNGEGKAYLFEQIVTLPMIWMIVKGRSSNAVAGNESVCVANLARYHLQRILAEESTVQSAIEDDYAMVTTTIRHRFDGRSTVFDCSSKGH